MKTIFATAIDRILTRRILILLVLMLLMNVGVFGQNASETKQEVLVNIDNRSSEQSNMDLASWLTGSRQSQLMKNATPEISTNKSAKQQFINCGMSVNRVLSRTLLKKVMARDTGIA